MHRVGLRDQTFPIERRSFAIMCELFVENPKLLKRSHEVQSRASEAYLRLFLGAIAGEAAEIRMENKRTGTFRC
jgi:hypothetical protein